MNKVYFNNLTIELTRRCNMACAHCMRGDAENVDISNEAIDCLLGHIAGIDMLAIDGGEAALVPEKIRYLANRIKELGIPLGGLYMTTNGKEVSDEFLSAVTDLFLCTKMDKACNSIVLSQDMFHEDIPPENKKKLETLQFFDESGGKRDFSESGLINLGRAKDLCGLPKSGPIQPPFELEAFDGLLCINSFVTCTVHGDLLKGCDYEYANTEPVKFGSVFDKNLVSFLWSRYAGIID